MFPEDATGFGSHDCENLGWEGYRRVRALNYETMSIRSRSQRSSLRRAFRRRTIIWESITSKTKREYQRDKWVHLSCNEGSRVRIPNPRIDEIDRGW